MKLSIITVVYNDSKGLSSTIDSLTNQNNKNFEHVIIDGNSNDDTLEIIYKNADNVDFFISEPDNGIYDAMNKGVINASGDFVSFLNAGDIALPNYTETCIDFFSKNTSLDFCYASIIMTSKRGENIYHPRRIDEWVCADISLKEKKESFILKYLSLLSILKLANIVNLTISPLTVRYTQPPKN